MLRTIISEALSTAAAAAAASSSSAAAATGCSTSAPAAAAATLLMLRRSGGPGMQMQHMQQPARSYHKNVVDHYERPRNVGSFDKNDPNVGTGLVGAPACGDVMKLQIKVDADGNIVDSCFKTFGCGSAIASSSVATEWVKGKSLDEVTGIKNSDIAKHLSLPPVKLHCSMLAEDAIKAAVKDIKAKREAAKAAAP
jgi:nitrogen fixation NifU-like protein